MIVCTLCKREVPNRYEQFAVRVEVRRLDAKERPFVKQVALICRDCIPNVDAERVAQEVLPL